MLLEKNSRLFEQEKMIGGRPSIFGTDSEPKTTKNKLSMNRRKSSFCFSPFGKGSIIELEDKRAKKNLNILDTYSEEQLIEAIYITNITIINYYVKNFKYAK